MNDLFVLILIIASAAAYTAYRIGRWVGYGAGYGRVFDEVKEGWMPVCYQRGLHIVGEVKPLFKPLNKDGAAETPTWFIGANEPLIDAKELVTCGLTATEIKAQPLNVPPTRYVHPFLSPVTHG